MITIQPFKALRPGAQFAKQVASKPYDVLSSREAKTEAQGNPNSFLHITKSEIDLPESISPYSPEVYAKARENLDAFISRDILFHENKRCYYIYQLVMPEHFTGNEHAQTGLVCCSSLKDYDDGLIKKHEFTRPDKELDRITHIKTTAAQTGNVFLTYRRVSNLDIVIEKCKSDRAPVYDFIADDGIRHSIWVVNDLDIIDNITHIFKAEVPCTYIADGHHRAASAAKSREAFASKESNYFLTTLFPANQLKILEYNRVIKDLNGLTVNEFFDKIQSNFTLAKKDKPVQPLTPHTFGMYINKEWFLLQPHENLLKDISTDLLDVTLLQTYILDPLFDITDQRTDKKIDFVGGIRGLSELEKRVDSGEMAIAFSLYPVSITQLLDIADKGEIMPPKSTWFEPKLRDGLLTHTLNR